MHVSRQKISYRRTRLDLKKRLNPGLNDKYQCRAPVLEPVKSFSIPFNGNELIDAIARDFRGLWAKQPFYMSSASSNFPGLIGSMDMINGFKVLGEKRDNRNKVMNKWIREILLGLINAGGHELKDRIFKPKKGDQYHIKVPNQIWSNK